MQRTIVKNQFPASSESIDNLWDWPGVAGIEVLPRQRNTIRTLKLVMANGKNGEAQVRVPKLLTYRHKLEYVPEVRATFRKNIGILGDTSVQLTNDLCRDIQFDELRVGALVPIVIEQAFESTNMVKVCMRNEYRFWRSAVVLPGVVSDGRRTAIHQEQW